MFDRNPYTDRPQRGVAVLGIVLMVALVLAIAGFAAWTLSQKQEPVIKYTPPAASADDALTEGSSTKEIFQDVKILEAGLKRADDYRKAADKVLSDAPLAIETSETTNAVEQDRLSELQTDFIAECDRRIKALTDAQPLLTRLTDSQRPVVEASVNKEITDLNAMKARVAAATDGNAFSAERQALNQEYNAYLLASAQLNLLVFANDQSLIEEKINKIGGKFQERINDASSQGVPTAEAQTPLNSYQANKVTAQDLTSKVIKVLPTIKAGEPASSRASLKTYFAQLSTAHNELIKALTSAKLLAAEMQQFDSAQ